MNPTGVRQQLWRGATQPKAAVVETWSVNGCDIQLRRYLSDGEMDRIDQLLQDISTFKGTSPTSDTIS